MPPDPLLGRYFVCVIRLPVVESLKKRYVVSALFDLFFVEDDDEDDDDDDEEEEEGEEEEEEGEEEEEANPPTDPLLPFASNLLAFDSKSLSPDPGGFFRLLPRSE